MAYEVSFLSLPREVRDVAYNIALIYDPCTDCAARKRHCGIGHGGKIPTPGFARVNHQIYKEANRILWESNVVRFSDVERFCQLLDTSCIDNVKLIRCLCVKTTSEQEQNMLAVALYHQDLLNVRLIQVNTKNHRNFAPPLAGSITSYLAQAVCWLLERNNDGISRMVVTSCFPITNEIKSILRTRKINVVSGKALNHMNFSLQLGWEKTQDVADIHQPSKRCISSRDLQL